MGTPTTARSQAHSAVKPACRYPPQRGGFASGNLTVKMSRTVKNAMIPADKKAKTDAYKSLPAGEDTCKQV